MADLSHGSYFQDLKVKRVTNCNIGPVEVRIGSSSRLYLSADEVAVLIEDLRATLYEIEQAEKVERIGAET